MWLVAAILVAVRNSPKLNEQQPAALKEQEKTGQWRTPLVGEAMSHVTGEKDEPLQWQAKRRGRNSLRCSKTLTEEKRSLPPCTSKG